MSIIDNLLTTVTKTDQWNDIRFLLHLTLISLSLFIIGKWLKKYVENRLIYNRIPHITSTCILGNILGHLEYFWTSRTHLSITTFFGSFIMGMTKICHQQNSGLFYFRLGPLRNIVMLLKGRTAEQFLNNSKNIIKAAEYDFLKPWLGEGLLTGKGRHWKRHRKLLTPAFHFEILEKFVPTMSSKIKTMLSLFEKKLDPTSGSAHIDDIRPYITNCTVDIICETAMGIKMTEQEEWWARQQGDPEVRSTPGTKYVAAVKSYLEIVLKRFFTPWMHSDALFRFFALGRLMHDNLRVMHNFIDKVILARKMVLQSQYNNDLSIEENFANMTKNKRVAFLDLVLGYHLKDSKEMDLVSLREETNTFMFGGHDTTSTTLHFAFLLLGLNIEKQRKIQDELDDLFGDDIGREITLNDVKRMTYLDMAVREVMRLFPAAAFFARRVVQEVSLDGYRIPVGTTVMILTYSVHRDPDVYQQPDKFIPERFAPNSVISKNPYSFIPFSAGPRNCIGQRFAMLELKLVLASVLRKYNLKTLTRIEDVEVNISIISKSNTAIEVELTRR